MLGYVRASKPSMRIGDYRIYKGIYCSLCRALGRNYGVFGRIMLNYDFTFAAVMLLALGDESCTFCAGRCPFMPAKRCIYCGRGEFDYCAHGVVITAYYKLRDDLADKKLSKKLAAALLLPAVSLMHKKAMKKAPEIEEIISRAMSEQAQAEKSEKPDIDTCSHPGADALGQLVSSYAGDDSGSVYRFGYMLGRLIYIMDAADDFERDLKCGDFNPFAAEFADIKSDENRAAFILRARELMNQTHSAFIDSYEKLEPKRFTAIADNIVYEGQAVTIDRIAAKYAVSNKDKPKSFTIE